MIIDSHAHISKRTAAKPEILIQDMDLAGIDKAVLVPGGMLDIRKMSEYTTLRERPEPVQPDNEYVEHCVALYPERFIGFYCINPLTDARDIESEVKLAIQKGFKGIKLAPLVHPMSFLEGNVNWIAELCSTYDIPLYTHVTVNEETNTFALESLVAKHPNTTIIIGHMGIGDVDQHAINLASEFPNVYLETSLAPILALKLAIKQAGVKKLLFGTEFPLSDAIVEREKINRLSLSDEEKQMILGGNFARLLTLTIPIEQRT
ncbi:amidohydrolase family protein [Metabacillus sp. FJAT-53654]|uniref:Amidohydrolase family protein n=1 Tax=Metabacillus rhizosphaerae TaxID=3117747 RepID=A0ABZ2MTD1_9BACI